MACISEDEKKKLIVRLNRISGQINGLGKMIEQDRECIDVLNQIVSAQAALRGVWKQVVRGHLSHCVADAIKKDKHSDEIIEELVEHIEKLR